MKRRQMRGLAVMVAGVLVAAALVFLACGNGPAEVREEGRSSLATAWRELLDRDDVLILDTETTGLGDDAEVLEVVAVDTRGETRLNVLSLPEGRIPEAASKLHGLTREELVARGARPWPEVHSEVLEALQAASTVVAWNSTFDETMLRQTSERHGLQFPDLNWRDGLDDYRSLDYDGNNLSTAAERHGVPAGKAHRAEADCRMVLGIMRAVSHD